MQSVPQEPNVAETKVPAEGHTTWHQVIPRITTPDFDSNDRRYQGPNGTQVSQNETIYLL